MQESLDNLDSWKQGFCHDLQRTISEISHESPSEASVKAVALHLSELLQFQLKGNKIVESSDAWGLIKALSRAFPLLLEKSIQSAESIQSVEPLQQWSQQAIIKGLVGPFLFKLSSQPQICSAYAPASPMRDKAFIQKVACLLDPLKVHLSGMNQKYHVATDLSDASTAHQPRDQVVGDCSSNHIETDEEIHAANQHLHSNMSLVLFSIHVDNASPDGPVTVTLSAKSTAGLSSWIYGAATALGTRLLPVSIWGLSSNTGKSVSALNKNNLSPASITGNSMQLVSQAHPPKTVQSQSNSAQKQLAPVAMTPPQHQLVTLSLEFITSSEGAPVRATLKVRPEQQGTGLGSWMYGAYALTKSHIVATSWTKGKSFQKQGVTLSPEVEVEGDSGAILRIKTPSESPKEEAGGDMARPSAIPNSIDKSEIGVDTASGTYDDDDLDVLEDMRLVLGGHHDHFDHHIDRSPPQTAVGTGSRMEVTCTSSFQECNTERQPVGSFHTYAEGLSNCHSSIDMQSIDSSRQEGNSTSSLSMSHRSAQDQAYIKSQNQVCNSNHSSSGGGAQCLPQSVYGTNIVRLILTMSQSGSEQQQYLKQAGQCAGCNAALESYQQPKRNNSYFWNASLCKAGPRFCFYTGKLFCNQCHQQQMSVIPADVLHQWDFSPKSVCCSAHEYLASISDQPLLCITAINPGLYSKVDLLSQAKKLRQKTRSNLLQAGKSGDKGAAVLEIHRMAGLRAYLLGDMEDFWSLADLIDLSKGSFSQLLEWLKQIEQQSSLLTQ